MKRLTQRILKQTKSMRRLKVTKFGTRKFFKKAKTAHVVRSSIYLIIQHERKLILDWEANFEDALHELLLKLKNVGLWRLKLKSNHRIMLKCSVLFPFLQFLISIFPGPYCCHNGASNPCCNPPVPRSLTTPSHWSWINRDYQSSRIHQHWIFLQCKINHSSLLTVDGQPIWPIQ